jgi:hypothetical protein
MRKNYSCRNEQLIYQMPIPDLINEFKLMFVKKSQLPSSQRNYIKLRMRELVECGVVKIN